MRNNRGSVTTLILIVLIVAAIIWFLAPKFINAGSSVETSAGSHVENAARRFGIVSIRQSPD